LTFVKNLLLSFTPFPYQGMGRGWGSLYDKVNEKGPATFTGYRAFFVYAENPSWAV